jgi:hypothetical protein
MMAGISPFPNIASSLRQICRQWGVYGQRLSGGLNLPLPTLLV